MATRFELDPIARDELIRSHDRIAQHSPETAERWVRGLIAQINSVLAFPRRCPLAPEARNVGGDVQELLCGKRPNKIYRVLDQGEGEVIRVLAIRDASHRGYSS